MVFDLVFESKFLPHLICDDRHCALKATSKDVMRCLMRYFFAFWAEHRRRFPDNPVWVARRPFR